GRGVVFCGCPAAAAWGGCPPPGRASPRLPFQFGKHAPGRLLVPAAGRNNLHMAGTVPELGDVATRLDDNSSTPVLPRRQRRCPVLALAVFPSGEAFALADENLRPGRQCLRHGRLVHSPHRSPTLSLWSQLQSKILGQAFGSVKAEGRLAT